MASGSKQLVTSANRWRDEYNPLRGLNMSRAVALLESMNSGRFTELMWLYKHIEETDPDGIALVERGLSALEELDYDIKVTSKEKAPDTWDEGLAEDQRAFLARRYSQVENLNDLIAHMALGFFRKYAFAQILTNPEGPIVRIETHDQWNFVRDGLKGPFYWNRDAKAVPHTQLGAPLDKARDRLIVMEYDRHVDRYGLLKFLRSNLAEKDWDGFIETFGFDQTIVILPPDVPDDKVAEYLETAGNISNGGNGALPHGAGIEHGNDSRGAQPFKPRLEWLQQQHILAGTAGMLTMLTQSGSGTLAGGAHTDTWKTLARARGKRVGAVMHSDFDRPELALAFPGKPILAYFCLATNEEQDVGDVVDHAVKIRTAFPDKTMDPDEFTEKTGYTLVDAKGEDHGPQTGDHGPKTEDLRPQTLDHGPQTGKKDDPEGGPAAQAQNRRGPLDWLRRVFGRDPGETAPSAADRRQDSIERIGDRVAGDLEAAARRAMGDALSEDLLPLIERLQKAAQADDADILDEAIAIYNEAPELLEAMAADSAVEPALAEIITAAIVNGAAEGIAAHGGLAQEGQKS